jgi:hypothetical protein
MYATPSVFSRKASVAGAVLLCAAAAPVALAWDFSWARADRNRNESPMTAQIDRMHAITNKLVRGWHLGIRDFFLWSRTRRSMVLGDEVPVDSPGSLRHRQLFSPAAWFIWKT